VELGAAFLCADLDLTPEPRSDHASYIDHWLKVSKSDNRAIFAAASHAQRAAASWTACRPPPLLKPTQLDQVTKRLMQAENPVPGNQSRGHEPTCQYIRGQELWFVALPIRRPADCPPRTWLDSFDRQQRRKQFSVLR
jgi:hypothetical protein